jgi:hypothetical protein
VIKIKKGLKISTADFWYDITDGGYLKPEEICELPEDAKRIRAALAILEDFRDSCEKKIKDFVR